MPLPKVSIYYCARCKWQNRAVWYMQEVLQTFSDPEKNLVPEVALCPSFENPGLFQITVTTEQGEQIVYKRRMKKVAVEEQSEAYYYDGFPDSKLVKNLIRDALFPESGLGHAENKQREDPGLVLCEKCNDNK
ncbi:hypothetical protein ACI3LY_004875 [Candidozyma auris]|uniref:Uncharacterized protein n=2 Tax=Candidozyma auris TaxID=498019 RepID=A0A2H0ZXK6_CANAR|nr:hypothetical_protein [[Candida] auris]PIS54743.1 hypothetical protein B9J08_002523 [[Candida] auris]PIS55369.1 hypothetical protein CJI97_002068 [[Candida] auris]QEO24153.1 hypothetical_protein [[Candida] auris]GBL52604.1 putative selT/selW/selH selenoprotein domain [[Candida] auris]